MITVDNDSVMEITFGTERKDEKKRDGLLFDRNKSVSGKSPEIINSSRKIRIN
jgi:hypothetical protein